MKKLNLNNIIITINNNRYISHTELADFVPQDRDLYELVIPFYPIESINPDPDFIAPTTFLHINNYDILKYIDQIPHLELPENYLPF